jgi:hypothetical protein
MSLFLDDDDGGGGGSGSGGHNHEIKAVNKQKLTAIEIKCLHSTDGT